MTPFERACLHVSVALAALTGIVYGGLKYFASRPGEFGVEAHPWQGTAQHLHVLLVPLLVFGLGWILPSHVLPKWRGGKAAGRLTGGLLALGFAPMILSGYAVQVAVDPAWRTFWAWLHGATSLAFCFGFAAHLARIWREKTSESGMPEGFPDPD